MKKILIAILILISGCDDVSNSTETPMTNQSEIIEIELLSSIKNITKNTPTPFTESCMPQVNICWYKIQKSANDTDLPTINLKNNGSILSLEQAVNITVALDKDTTENIENLNVILRGLPKGSTHEQYRDLIFSLIDKIKKSGWSHFYFPEDPRISGSQAGKISSPDEVFGRYVSSHPWLDPDYQLDLKRWLQIGSFYRWYFYKDGIYLNLKAWKQNDSEAPTEKATYLITLDFQSESEFWLDGITDKKERQHWKELLPGRLNAYHKTRLELEEKARAAGIEIDESYQDPLIHALNN
ncbi:hypothetical protein C1X50_01480 [Pseudomonas sp. MPR-TSA4]|nr:hypothetical protein C1X50_01480 [Pseudomonas sp. MPR-TSA4]